MIDRRLPFFFLMALTTMITSPQTASSEPGSIAIIPQPTELQPLSGAFIISGRTAVIADGPALAEADKLVGMFAPAMGTRLQVLRDDRGQADAILLRIDPALTRLTDEGYQLEVQPGRITLAASAPAGLFYGIQTLRQLMPPAIFRRAAVPDAQWRVPCVKITDLPRFRWRGLLLDTARHFMPKSFILKLIDAMALHKLNTLQLHLTDDQGWRIQIRKYPRLTEVGAWRDETLIGHPLRDKPWRFDGRRHGGFYTQDDIREIVRYAADRHISVVPEIEMPGHARAALSAYPELGCNPDQLLEPWTVWGVCPDIYAPTERTVSFMQDVLTEVLELFPSRFIHIGGDEAIKDQWKASPAIQARIRALGLKDEAAMQSWFIHQMDAWLTAHGRRMVG